MGKAPYTIQKANCVLRQNFADAASAVRAVERLAADDPGAEIILTRHPTGDSPYNPKHVAAGQARAQALTPERRSQIATNASLARARALSPERRKEISAKASAARWPKLPPGDEG